MKEIVLIDGTKTSFDDYFKKYGLNKTNKPNPQIIDWNKLPTFWTDQAIASQQPSEDIQNIRKTL